MCRQDGGNGHFLRDNQIAQGGGDLQREHANDRACLFCRQRPGQHRWVRHAEHQHRIACIAKRARGQSLDHESIRDHPRKGRGREGRQHDIGRCHRQAHAQNKACHCDHDDGDQQVATRPFRDHQAECVANTCRGDHVDHKADRGEQHGRHNHPLGAHDKCLEHRARTHGVLRQPAGRDDRKNTENGRIAGRESRDQQPDQQPDGDHEAGAALFEGRADGFPIAFHRFEVQPARLDPHEENNGKKVEQGRQGSDGNDGFIRDLGKARHDESACAHDRRHQLPACRRGGLDPAGKLGWKPRLFHQRDRDDTGGCGIGHRRARDCPGQARGDDRHDPRPADQTPCNGAGDVDDKITRARAQQERPEDDEQEYEGR